MDRGHLYGATFGIAGVLLAGIQMVHATQQTDVPVAIVVDGVPFALLGLSISFVGYWLATNDEFTAEVPRVAGWAVGGSLLLAAVAALTLFSQQVATGTLGRVQFVTLDNVTVGAVAGTVVGLYDARSQRTLGELQRERDRSEEFARKAADLNNYGRALAQAATIEEVSAYCIEGVSSLLGLDESAFVEVDETALVISSTISTISDSTIRTLAMEADDDEAIVAVREHPELPESIESVLTLRLDTSTETTGVLIAVRESGEALSTEDEQLLELLGSHASMVLDRIYEDRVNHYETV